MKPITRLASVAVPLNMINIDTDMIIPKEYLKTITRTGLGKGLFAELRYDSQGRDNPLFTLNQPPYKGAEILVTGKNFGCGSSREHAPWALLDFGFRCIIAPSFADIFYNNTFQNGILPVTLPEQRIDELMRLLLELAGAEIAVDLEVQTVTGPDEQIDHFEINPFRKSCLIEGITDISLTDRKADKIKAYEDRISVERPWAAAAARHA